MKYIRIGLVFAGCSLLVGCNSENSVESLKVQMAAIEKKKDPVPELEKDIAVSPQVYDDNDLKKIDPFGEQKLVALLGDSKVDSACAAELKLAKNAFFQNPLQAVALDAIKFVGIVRDNAVAKLIPNSTKKNTITGKSRLYAMVLVDGKIHTVAHGQFLGQNYGKITDITDTEIKLRELVENGAGDCTERQASLPLQDEAAK